MHYRLATGSRRRTCSVLGCGNEATHGAHVMLGDLRSALYWHIVLTCSGCNHPTNDGDMYLKEGVELVPANVSLMGCRKR